MEQYRDVPFRAVELRLIAQTEAGFQEFGGKKTQYITELSHFLNLYALEKKKVASLWLSGMWL